METCPTAHKPYVSSMPHDSILLSIRRCLNRQSYLGSVGSTPHHTNCTCCLSSWVLRCTDPIIYVCTTHRDTRYGLERGGGAANGAGTASGLWGATWSGPSQQQLLAAVLRFVGRGPLYIQSVLQLS